MLCKIGSSASCSRDTVLSVRIRLHKAREAKFEKFLPSNNAAFMSLPGRGRPMSNRADLSLS